MGGVEEVLLCGGYSESMDGDARGIGLLRDGGDGVTFAGVIAEASSPSFLLQRREVVYAVDEAHGAVAAFRLSGSGLVPWGSQPTSGELPCHLSADDRWLYAANYGSGSLDVFPIRPDGSLSPRHQTLEGEGNGPHAVQEGPHAHSTLRVGDLVYSTDLGADRVHLHRWVDDRLTRVDSIELPAGSGPRDLLQVNGRVLVLGELSQRVYELAGRAITTSGPLVIDMVPGDHAAALVADADGRFLFSCLRGSDRVAVIDAVTLSPVFATSSQGHWPRYLAVVGHRLFVANQLSGDIVTFSIESGTGVLQPKSAARPVPSPTFVLATQWPDFAEPESLIK